MVFQEPFTCLNPVQPIATQVAEVIELHQGLTKALALEQAIVWLEKTGIPDAAKRGGQYPHQWSGGMRQRAMIAMGLACRPALLIISHDLGVIHAMAPKVAVMHSGAVVESGGAEQVFGSPSHSATRSLMGAYLAWAGAS